MGIYDKRTTPAYRTGNTPRSYSRNKCILKWWTQEHDQLIVQRIAKDQWLWYWEISNDIVKITPPEILDAWREEDSLCAQYAWYNILMYFAISRADVQGFTKKIRKPIWKVCPLCNERFVEDSLPGPLVKRIGIDHIEFCSPCLSEVFFWGADDLSRADILEYLQKLTAVLQRVPNQGFGEGIGDLDGLDYKERLALFQVLKGKPTVRNVKEVFGSWLKALIEAGILEDGTRRTGRGTQCLAKDGHVCLSLGEKTIDDLLFRMGIAHEKEPHYPEGNYRADFQVGDTLIEYFGLKGNPDYDAKTAQKQRLCRKHGIRLISIYPSDLVSTKKLSKKLGELG